MDSGFTYSVTSNLDTLDPNSAAAASTLFGGMTLFFLCFACVMTIVWILITVWVYKDAQKRANPNAVIWTVATFFLGIIGLIAYMLAGRNQSAPQK